MSLGEKLFVSIYVAVEPGMSGVVTNAVQVSGGGALPAVASFQNMVSSSPSTPGLTSFEFTLAGADGALDTQAGDHPAGGATASFQFASELKTGNMNQGLRNESHKYPTIQGVKDVVVDLPPGFVGNTQEATECGQRELEPSQEEFVYNMVPDHGYPAEFGFNIAGHAILLYATAIPSSRGYVLQVSSRGDLRFLSINGLSLTFWGVPGEASHDVLRGGPSVVKPVGFLTNPVDCSAGPLTATAMSDTWQDPGRWTADGSPDLTDPAWRVKSSTVYPSITGCSLLQFAPGVEVTPEVTRADEPSGLTVDIRVPQAPQLPPDLVTPEFKNVAVTLPSGVASHPSMG